MGFLQAEEVLLPVRFLLKTAHFIAVLTIVFDIDAVTTNMTQVDPSSASAVDTSDFDSVKKKVQGLSYAALACFGIEYITLFMGVSIFLRPLNLLNILAHGVGLILTILLYVDDWNLNAYIAFFTVFNAAPTVLELLILFFYSRFSFVKY